MLSGNPTAVRSAIRDLANHQVHVRTRGQTLAFVDRGASGIQWLGTSRQVVISKTAALARCHPSNPRRRKMRLRGHVAFARNAVGLPAIEGVDTDKQGVNGRTPLHVAMARLTSAGQAFAGVGASLGLPSGFVRKMAEALVGSAVSEGNVGMMRSIHQHVDDVDNIVTPVGSWALHEASEADNVGAVEVLVGAGADVNRRDSRGFTPLHRACAKNASGAMVALLMHGAHVDALDNDGCSPLHVIANGYDDVLQGFAIDILCHAGADIELRRTTCAEISVFENKIRDIQSTDCAARSHPVSALGVAAHHGRADILRALLRNGADVDAVSPNGSFTALVLASLNGHVKAIDALVAAGADVDGEQSVDKTTALQAAVRADSPEAICALARHGADLHKTDSRNETPLLDAITYDSVDIIEALLTAGADPNFPNCSASSPMMMAIHGGQSWSIKMLAQHGAHVKPVPEFDVGNLLVTAMEIFQGSGVIDALVEAGADINCWEWGKTPLQAACTSPYDGQFAIPSLLRHGADVNMPDSDGYSPLHLVVMSDDCAYLLAEVVDMLLRAGADETAVNDDGLTPADQLRFESEHGRGSGEGAGCVHELLKRAPADRTWRRRGLFLLFRAYSRKAPLEPRGGGSKILTRRGRSIGADNGSVQRDASREDTGAGEFSSVVEWLIGVEEEGIFRKVVCFL